MCSIVLGRILHKAPLQVLNRKKGYSSYLNQENAGFTLIEVIVVFMMIGILAAIAAPNWLAFVNRQHVNKANDVILSAIQEAQKEAKKRKMNYSISFRTDNNIAQIAIHPKDSTPDKYWRNLGGDVGIKPEKIVLGTNLTNNNATTKTQEVLYASAFDSSKPQTITFDYTGALDLLAKTNTESLTVVQKSNLGYNDSTKKYRGLIIAVAVPKPGVVGQASSVKRCVIVKTILGATTIGKNDDCL